MRVRIVSLMVAGMVVGSLCVGGTASAAAPTGRHHRARVTTVVSGLDNPRDIAFSKDGELFVAEAGHGGKSCFSDPELGTSCLGFTSGISRVYVGRSWAKRIVSGLVSTAGPDGSFATGVDGISILGERIFGIETGSSLAVPSGAFPRGVEARAKREFGRLVVTDDEGGWWKTLANVGDRDYRWSGRHRNLVPGQFPDANPYGVLALRGSSWVVDAGSNTIDRVGRDGEVEVAAFIPNPPSSDSVPTCIDEGWDHALYIGELTGGGNKPGASIVWRYDPRTGKLTKWASGLTAVTGCGFADNGKFYATEFSSRGLDEAAPSTGRVVLVRPHSDDPITIVDGLSFPGGFAARGDSLYVSNWSIAPARGPVGQPTGSVVRIRLPR